MQGALKKINKNKNKQWHPPSGANKLGVGVAWKREEGGGIKSASSLKLL